MPPILTQDTYMYMYIVNIYIQGHWIYSSEGESTQTQHKGEIKESSVTGHQVSWCTLLDQNRERLNPYLVRNVSQLTSEVDTHTHAHTHKGDDKSK